MAKYVYPAIFSQEESGYSINFPDIPGCYTQGEDVTEGMEMASDVLCLRLYHMETSGEAIPPATDIRNIIPVPGEFTTLISCDTLEYKKFYTKKSQKSVKKTLSIPSWLNELAEENHVNFSALLQSALKEHLNVH